MCVWACMGTNTCECVGVWVYHYCMIEVFQLNNKLINLWYNVKECEHIPALCQHYTLCEHPHWTLIKFSLIRSALQEHTLTLPPFLPLKPNQQKKKAKTIPSPPQPHTPKYHSIACCFRITPILSSRRAQQRHKLFSIDKYYQGSNYPSGLVLPHVETCWQYSSY